LPVSEPNLVQRFILFAPFLVWLFLVAAVLGLGWVVSWLLLQFDPKFDSTQALLIGVIVAVAASHWTVLLCTTVIQTAAAQPELYGRSELDEEDDDEYDDDEDED